MPEKRHAGATAATALVVANMVGTGVFISLGYQLLDFHAAPPILLLWIVGGLIALCGAYSYAEVAAALPRSGGEYHFLGTLYHPSLGFMAGLMSAVIGFAAPTAVTALALGGYLHRSFSGIPAGITATAVILLGSASHALSARTSARVQIAATALKLSLIGAFLIAVLILPGHGDIRWQPAMADIGETFRPVFASALLFVFYAYSGWNAAVYGLEEWHEPERTVKRALIGGTLLVLVLYVALNAAFLRAAPVDELRGVPEIADVAARHLFGPAAARWTSALLAVGLFSSVSALLWAGPRVLGTMGRDVRALRWFAPHQGVPLRALSFQTALALGFVWFGKLDALVNYTQTGLTLCSALTVAGVFILKKRGLGRRLHPLPPVVFLAMTSFVIVQSLIQPNSRPAALAGLATALCCALLWFPLHPKSR
jgi:APA family basic amino acid/polyamine antiporter